MRLSRLYSALETSDSAWDTALIFGRVNQYYLAGTMQDAVLVLRRVGDFHLFVRRDYERAVEESPLANVHTIQSCRGHAGGCEHDELLTRIVPDLLKAGMSEAQLFGEFYRSMMEMNHQGIARFSGFGTEMQIGRLDLAQ